MVRLTLLARITDGLPLAEGLEDDQNHDLLQFKQQAKACLLLSIIDNGRIDILCQLDAVQPY